MQRGRVLNFTPHDVAVHVNADTTIVFPRLLQEGSTKSAEIRLVTTQRRVGDLCYGQGQSCEAWSPQEVIDIAGLPAYDRLMHPTHLLVSAMVGEYLAAHPDTWPGGVYAPDSSPASVVRDEKGQIVGVKRVVLYKVSDT